MTSNRICLLPIVLVCGVAPAWSAISTHLDPKASGIRTVCVLPPEAQLNRIGFKGAEPLLNESEQWATHLRDTMQQSVIAAGGEIEGDLSRSALESDEDLRESVRRLLQKYEGIAVQMQKKPGEVKKGRYTLGDEVALLPCSARADSLLFISAKGLLQTGGKKAAALLVGGITGIMLIQARYDIWIAVVDARTGNVTALMRSVTLGGKTASDPEIALGKQLTEEFKKIHIGDTRRPSRLRDRSAL